MTSRVSREGKLIALHLHSNNSKAERAQFPLNTLPFYFTTPPAEITYGYGVNTGTQNIINRGTIVNYGGPSLRTVSFSSMFPVKQYYELDNAMRQFVMEPPSGEYQFYDARRAENILRALMEEGKVFELFIRDRQTGQTEYKRPSLITAFNTREIGGEPDVKYFDITFQQYRFLKIRKVPRAGKLPGGNGDRDDEKGRYLPSPYVVPKRIGIKRLAAQAYHDKSKWKVIFNANGKSAGLKAKGATVNKKAKNGPWIIPKGAKLRIPAIRIRK